MSGRGAWAWAAGVVALAAVAGALTGGGPASGPSRAERPPASEPARPPPAAEPETAPAPVVSPATSEAVRPWGHFVAPASWTRRPAVVSTGCALGVEFEPEVNPAAGSRFALVVTTLDPAGRAVVRWVQERFRAGETAGRLARVPIGDRTDPAGTRYRVAVYAVPERTVAAGYSGSPRGWVRASAALVLTRAKGYVPCG